MLSRQQIQHKVIIAIIDKFWTLQNVNRIQWYSYQKSKNDK